MLWWQIWIDAWRDPEVEEALVGQRAFGHIVSVRPDILRGRRSTKDGKHSKCHCTAHVDCQLRNDGDTAMTRRSNISTRRLS